MEVGYKLRQKRLNKGYTQEYMSENLGISQKTYSNFESGKSDISLPVLEKAANILEIDFLELLPERVTISNNEFKDNSSGYVVNNYPDKLIVQFEEIISLLKEKIDYLESK
ncbi:MAG: helix-turn-helix domain-containing protein [Flavobacteriaceae bacterium]|nr:helix-turn-helix domain-containing protein [Flavobacteriaceae bacterium]